MNIKWFTFVILVLFPLWSFAQKEGTATDDPPEAYHFMVLFTDKQGTPYSVRRPWEFLSARALQRRKRYGIAVDNTDLPVNPAYIDSLLGDSVRLHGRSRWLNATMLICTRERAQGFQEFPFVKQVINMGKHKPPKPRFGPDTLAAPEQEWYDTYYGLGGLQISMTEGNVLHQLGFTGREVWVHVQDGGFVSVDKMPVFHALRRENRLWQGRDFVDRDREVFESSSHGSQVLSVMGSFQPHFFVGTAPEATYILSKTEDTKGETWIEEFNWIMGAEYADSLGADLINSSLGYTTFNEKRQNWSYEQMDGATTWAVKGTDLAFAKGLIVVNSAGNEGNSKWHYIGTPADGRHTFSIGAVTWQRKKASFSSFGPTADGRIKPNVSAMGQSVVVASTRTEGLTISNGTSFSAPLVSGLLASLWQAFPERSNEEILYAVENTATQALQPDTALGYGIPRMYEAFRALNDRYVIFSQANPTVVCPHPNPIGLMPGGLYPEGALLRVYNFQGVLLSETALPPFPEQMGKAIPLQTKGETPPFFIQLVER